MTNRESDDVNKLKCDRLRMVYVLFYKIVVYLLLLSDRVND